MTQITSWDHKNGPCVNANFPAPYGFCPEDFNQRIADFSTMAEALDYAAFAGTGMNFYGAHGKIDFALSYAEIRHRAIYYAKRLSGLGLARGDRVGIIANMDPDFVCMFFACQYAGYLSVPLPVVTGLGGRQGYQAHLSRIIETSGAKAVFGQPETLPHLTAATENLPVDFVMDIAMLGDLPPVQHDLRPLEAEEPSHIQYSSGSTRQPLGIEISQSALLANARSIGVYGLKVDKGGRIASWLPYYHDMGLIGCLIVPVACQFTVDYLHTDAFAKRPLQWLKVISDARCTISFSPTFGYNLCTRRAAGKELAGLDLSCWKYAGIGGDMIQPEVFSNFAKTFAPYGFKAEALTASYGLAEATLAFSFAVSNTGIVTDLVDKHEMAANGIALAIPSGNPDNVADTRQFASCGFPLPDYEMEIRNDTGAALADRRIGSVFIKCPSLMSGYHENPEATLACMPGDGWLNTGDLGYIADGQLFITGRKKDMMIINGRNIWPQDIEWHAENNVEVLRSRDTAVFAVEASDGHEIPVILVQCRFASREKRDDLKKSVHAAVFRNTGIDCQVELIPQRSLPFTTSGKLSRTKARQAWLDGMYVLSLDMPETLSEAA